MTTRAWRRDAGIHMVLVVLLVLITVALVYAATIIFAQFKEAERVAKALKQEITILEEREGRIKAEIDRAILPTGLAGKEGEIKLPITEAADLARKNREEYMNAARPNRLPLVEPKGGVDDAKVAAVREGSSLYGTLQEQVVLAAAWADIYKNRAAQLSLEVETAKQQADNRDKIKPDIMKRKQEYKDLLLGRIQEVNKFISDENAAYEERKKKLAEDKAKAEMEMTEEAAKFAEYEIKILNETRELRRQLEDLKVKEVIKHDATVVHGRVLRPDVPNKTAFIDVGSRERVVPGLKFLVGRRGLQGKFEIKGKIEVKKAWVTYSEVSIIEVSEAAERPITEGDQIVNPLFSKERPVIVAFAGEERARFLKYSVDEATRRIKEIGSEVRKDLGLDVDYMIFTETGIGRQRESYESFRKAVFLEMPVADASDIFRFLGD